MPELSGLGPLEIGTETNTIMAGERSLDVRLWYPSSRPAPAVRAVYRHTLAIPGTSGLAIAEHGCAAEGASPIPGQRYPLVIMSHGFGGWGTAMSQLGEALASRGYIVASIDHGDLAVRDLASFAASFGSVLRNRANDQRIVLRSLLEGRLASLKVARLIDPQAVGLIGYSMGGYGALTVAGAQVDESAPAFASLPPSDRSSIASPDPAVATKIKAVVAIAPWGGQPDAGVWDDNGLTGITAPLLLIDGDRDDVVDFKRGVMRVFAASKSSDRYLLIFREAAHNIAGNQVSLPAGAPFAAIEYVSDSVWRKDRLEAINEHFITAFFDRTLKHDAAKSRYLDVPTPLSDDGSWPSTFSRQWGGTTAGDEQPGYWRGFQRRWARGMEMHHRSIGQ